MKDNAIYTALVVKGKLFLLLFICMLPLLGCGFFDEVEQKVIRPVVDMLIMPLSKAAT